MSDRADNPGALLLSLAIHAGFLASLWLVTMSCGSYNELVGRISLPQWLHMECARPLSVQGPVIEAMLVDFSAKPLPRAAATPKPPPPKPPDPKPPQPEPEPPPPELPDAPPLAEDTVDQEEIDREALEMAEAQREQEERRRKEQQLLEEEQELQARIERERLEQLQDIRRQREEAAERREAEELKLAQLEQREIEAEQAEEMREEAEQMSGNEGINDDLQSRYLLAIQQTIERNWLRPETVPERVPCNVTVIQIPGGEVISVEFGSCSYDELARQSVDAALRREPLPYDGYESVFSRKLEIPFCYPAEECPK